VRVPPNASRKPPGLSTRYACDAHVSHHAWNAREKSAGRSSKSGSEHVHASAPRCIRRHRRQTGFLVLAKRGATAPFACSVISAFHGASQSAPMNSSPYGGSQTTAWKLSASIPAITFRQSPTRITQTPAISSS
jgi:hypothetical protein